jgi:hypothetical protein
MGLAIFWTIFSPTHRVTLLLGDSSKMSLPPLRLQRTSSIDKKDLILLSLSFVGRVTRFGEFSPSGDR